MKSLLGARFRLISKSKFFRCGVAVLIALVLLLSLMDKLHGEKHRETLHSSSSSSSTAKRKSRNEVVNIILQAVKPNNNPIAATAHSRAIKGSDRKRSIKDSSENSLRILCYILLSRARVKTARVIKETWGSHCDDMLFFGGYEYPELPVTRLNVTEGYENLWGKAKAAILYLAENAKYKDFQYFLKADDDTFVIVENLRKFIRDNQHVLNKPVWFGFKLKLKRMPQGYMSGGAGYVFNSQALTQVSSILRGERNIIDNNIVEQADGYRQEKMLNEIGSCNVDGEYGVEDLELGKCFLNVGVESINTMDESGGERFLPVTYEVLLNGGISSFHWIWRQAWNRIKPGESCCSKDLISMHEVTPTQMKTLYHLLYKIQIAKK